MLLNLYLAFFVSRRAQFKPKRERAETERRGSGLRRESALSGLGVALTRRYYILSLKKKRPSFSLLFFFIISALSTSLARCGPLRCDRSPPSSGYRLSCCGRGLKVRDSDYVTAASLPRCVRLRQPRARAEKRNRIVYVIFFFIIHKVQLAYTLTQRRRDDLQRETSQLVYK